MAEFTKVHGAGYISRGRLSRDEAIKDARLWAQMNFDRAKASLEALSVPDDKLRVSIIGDCVTERLIEDLLPTGLPPIAAPEVL